MLTNLGSPFSYDTLVCARKGNCRSLASLRFPVGLSSVGESRAAFLKPHTWRLTGAVQGNPESARDDKFRTVTTLAWLEVDGQSQTRGLTRDAANACTLRSHSKPAARDDKFRAVTTLAWVEMDGQSQTTRGHRDAGNACRVQSHSKPGVGMTNLGDGPPWHGWRWIDGVNQRERIAIQRNPCALCPTQAL